MISVRLKFALCIALAAPAFPQDMSDGYYMSNPSAVTSSASDGQPIAGVTVSVESAAGTFSSTTDSFGWAVFPTLDIVGDPDLDPNLPSQEIVTLSVSADGYVPARVTRTLGSNAKRMQVALASKRVGGVTGWVTASVGGSFDIPGYGTLQVPPGVLLQDAYIQVSTVPTPAQSTGLFEDQLVHQVWIGARDQGGSLVDAVPSFYAGITLLAEPTLDPFLVGTVYSESWVCHLVDDSHTEIDSMPMTTPVLARSVEATIPVAGGSNLVTRTWDAGYLGIGAGPVPSGCQSSTSITLTLNGSRLIPVASSPMLCGEYANNASGSVEAGQTVIGSSSLSTSIMSEVKTTAKAVLSEIEGKVGSKIEVNSTTCQSTTTIAKGSAGVKLGNSLPGGECFNATAAIGIIMSNYAVFSTVREVCPDGVIKKTKTKIGEMEVSGGIVVWWNGMEAGNCPNCTGDETPPDVPGESE